MSAMQKAAAAVVQQWLSFRISGQCYGAPLAHVSEIIREGEITPVPGGAPDLLGIRHLRGRIVPVMDGRLRLGLPALPTADPTLVRIVVLTYGEELVGLRVDAVDELLNVDEALMLPPPPGRAPRVLEPVYAVWPWQGSFVALLEVARLCRLGALAVEAFEAKK